MKWQKGRQNSGYDKLSLFISKRLKFDSYILKIPSGVGVPEHTDPVVTGYSHYRLNIFLKGCHDINVDGHSHTWFGGRMMLFRPDIYRHSMKPSSETLYMLSIGWLRKSRFDK